MTPDDRDDEIGSTAGSDANDETPADRTAEPTETEATATVGSTDFGTTEKKQDSLKRTVLTGIGIVALVAILVAGLAAAVPVLMAPDPPEEPTYDEFDPDRVVADPLAAEGDISPDGQVGSPAGGTVVIDESNANRFERGDITPMVEAFEAAGYEVEFHQSGPMSESLSDADALVVIDPAARYDGADLEATEEFTDRGGRLLVLAEPDRFLIEAGLLGATIEEAESGLTEFSSRYGIHFDTRYVYDQQQNDGNYRHVVANPEGNAEISPTGPMTDVEDVALYTPTEVRASGDAEPVLTTSSSARMIDSDEQRSYTLAVQKDNVLAVGDSRFIADDRHSVGDNNVFLEHVIEFLISGDVSPASDDGGGLPDDVIVGGDDGDDDSDE
ncbi:MAG: hypothetical protein PPP58_05165 [Natronomonas sp.]